MYWKAIGPSRFKLRALALFSGTKIYLNRFPANDYGKLMGQHATELYKMTIVILLTLFLSFSMILIGPAYALVVHGEYNTPGGGILPFTDLETLNGYVINMIVQSSIALLSVLGSFSIEIANCIIINTVAVMSELTRNSMQNFNAGLVGGTFTVTNKGQLRDIFVRLQDVENFIRQFNDLYYWKLFLQPILTTPCVSLAIFAQLKVCFIQCV